MATCPECEFDEIETEDLEEGDKLSCPECGKGLVAIGDDEVELADEDEDLDEDEEDEEEEDEEEEEEEDEEDELKEEDE